MKALEESNVNAKNTSQCREVYRASGLKMNARTKNTSTPMGASHKTRQSDMVLEFIRQRKVFSKKNE